MLKNIDLPFIKIPSGEITSIDLIKLISKQNKPIILSTGMATIKEIRDCINLITRKKKKKNITIMHCVSSYPAEIRHLNINVIKKLKKVFNHSIGYSDHSLVDEACLAAVSLGASIVEKHVTIDKSLSGPDHKMSYTIKQFEKLVKKIRDIEIILGKDDKVFSKKRNRD